MDELYPMRFAPLLKRYLWGGRRLGELLGKSIGPENDYAESWEVCDFGSQQTRVAAGGLEGRTLRELVESCGCRLLGRHASHERFALLVKFLDAREKLSVQVHPNDAYAARLDPPQWGKAEAWVVLEAPPGSRLCLGLQPGVDRATLEDAIRAGDCESCLNVVEPKVGDCFYLPAGTVHALGAGPLVAEVQQTSDITYRLYDYNRRGADGKPRELHLARALEVVDFSLGPIATQQSQPLGEGRERLVACDKFVLDRWQIDRSAEIPPADTSHVLICIAGSATVEGDPLGEPLTRGGTVLLPPSRRTRCVTAHPTATVLLTSLP